MDTLSHSPEVKILSAVFVYRKALRVFEGEKRKEGSDKDGCRKERKKTRQSEK